MGALTQQQSVIPIRDPQTGMVAYFRDINTGRVWDAGSIAPQLWGRAGGASGPAASPTPSVSTESQEILPPSARVRQNLASIFSPSTPDPKWYEGSPLLQQAYIQGPVPTEDAQRLLDKYRAAIEAAFSKRKQGEFEREVDDRFRRENQKRRREGLPPMPPGPYQ